MNPLEALNNFKNLPGVQGGVIAEHNGRIVESIMPKGFGESHALQLGRECGFLAATITEHLDSHNEITVHGSSGSMYIVITKSHLFVIFLGLNANTSLLKMTTKIIFQKFESRPSEGKKRNAAPTRMLSPKPIINPKPNPTTNIIPEKPKPKSDGIWG
jgi:predicted regulator of Ras-like GTPase activity (Roadblock/LC7/MglB family)